MQSLKSSKQNQDHIMKMNFMLALDKQFVLRNLNYTSLSGLLQKGTFFFSSYRKFLGLVDPEEDDELL